MIEILFAIFMVMCVVYVVFNIKDFGLTWWRWITVVPIRFWEVIKKWTSKK